MNDQLAITVLLGDRDISDHYENVMRVNVLERAGTDLPTMALAVRLSDRHLPRRINEGNPVTVIFGGSDGTVLSEGEFVLQKPTLTRSGRDSWVLVSNGIKSTVTEWSRPRTEISGMMSGVERLEQVAARAEPVVRKNVDASRDRQHWIQYGQPDKVHVDETWLHCDLGDSFPMLANTLEEFRIVDAAALAETEPVVKFSNTDPRGKVYDWNYGAEQMSGFMASIGARGAVTPQFDLDEDVHFDLESGPSILLAVTNDPYDSGFSKTRDRKRILTRNVHANYWDSWAHNRTQLALYSSARYVLAWTDEHLPVKPLDLVSLDEVDISSPQDSEKVDAFDGNYIVAKTARLVEGNSFKTSIVLTREAFNENILQER